MHNTILWILLLGISFPLRAQSPLTTPEQVLNQYFERIGGKTTAQKVHTFASTGTTTLTRMSQKMTLSFDQGAQVGTGYYMNIAMNGRVMSTTKFDGQQVAEDGRVRKLATAERATQLTQTHLLPELYYLTEGYNLTLVGISSINGGNAYRIRAQKDDTTIELYYNVASGLKVREDITMPSPKGPQTSKAVFSNYKAVDGLQLPHTIKTEVQNGSALIENKYTRIQLNATLTADAFRIR